MASISYQHGNMAMDGSGSERDPVELLADDFVQRRRRGERPDIAEYMARFPHLASDIENVFPALLALEKAQPQSTSTPSQSTARLAELDEAPGSIGDYRILREIGRGAMGVVYEAEQQSLDRRVALKILPWHAKTSGIAVERFRREARAAARLHHTNIVPVFDVGQEGHVCYYAMQFIQGQSLDRVIGELRRLHSGEKVHDASPPESGFRPQVAELVRSLSGEVTPPPVQAAANGHDDSAKLQVQADTARLVRGSTVNEAALGSGSSWLLEPGRGRFYRNIAQIGKQAADALAYAHSRGIIHRDIKPSNLLLDAAGVVWVTDFGLAKTQDAAITRTGDLLGTLRYMAPERFKGECDGRADVYSLGVTLYELLTERPAHQASDGAGLIHQICHSDPPRPRSIDSGIPRDLEMIVQKALERDPRHRYPSASAVAEDLRRFLGDEPILGRKTPLPERLARWVRHNRSLAGGLALLVLALVISGIASAGFQSIAAREKAQRVQTTTNLYQSLVREAEALRLARREGYRAKVWSLLDQARQLDTPAVNANDLRREAVRSLGDFVGLSPVLLSDFPAEARSAAAGGTPLTVAVGLADGSIRWYDAEQGKLITEQTSHFAPVERLAWLADTDTFYSADARGVVKAWQRRGAAWQASRVAELDAPLLALVPVREGQVMAAYFQYGDRLEIAVENILTHRRTTIRPPGVVTAAAINPIGSLLAAVSENDLYVWETSAGGQIAWTTTPLGPLVSVAFDKHSQQVFVGCDQGLATFALPDLTQKTFLRSDRVPAGAFGEAGTLLAFASSNRRITLWNARGNRELAVLTHPGWHEFHTLVFASGGNTLVAGDGQSVRIWNVGGTDQRRVLAGHAGGVNAIAFSRDAKLLASASKDRTIALWDTTTGAQRNIESTSTAATAIDLSPDGRQVVVGEQSGDLRIYSAALKPGPTAISHSLGAIHAARFSPDGKLLAAAGERGLAVWRVTAPAEGEATGSVELLREAPGAAVAALQFSPDGQLLAWVSAGRELRAMTPENGIRWPLSTPRLLRGSENLAFAAGGQSVLFISAAGKLVEWNIVTDKQEFSVDSLEDFPGGHLAANASGHWLAMDLRPLEVAVFDLRSRAPLLHFREERAAVSALAFSRDSSLLAVATQDGSLGLWNLPAIRGELAKLELQWPENGDEAKAERVLQTPLEALSAAIERQPKDMGLRVRRGQILAQQEKLDDAAADFTAALGRDDKNLAALRGRAELHARANQAAEAAADYRRVLAIEPDHFDDWILTAVLLAKAGEAAEYRAHGEQLLARYGAETDPLTLERSILAVTLLAGAVPRGELPLARLEASLARADLTDGFRARAWLTIALAWLRLEDADKANTAIRRAQDESVYSETPLLQARAFALQAMVQDEFRQRELARTSLGAAQGFARTVPAAATSDRDTQIERSVLELVLSEAETRLAP